MNFLPNEGGVKPFSFFKMIDFGVRNRQENNVLSSFFWKKSFKYRTKQCDCKENQCYIKIFKKIFHGRFVNEPVYKLISLRPQLIKFLHGGIIMFNSPVVKFARGTNPSGLKHCLELSISDDKSLQYATY